jgi:lipopolysaccharide transport system ATP-binding protein
MGPAKEICERYYSHMNSHINAACVQDERSERELPTQLSLTTLAEDHVPSAGVILSDKVPAQGQQIIECFGFNMDSNSHGSGDAVIESVAFTDHLGRPLSTCEGRIPVKVRIFIRILNDIDRPIVGFIIKDRLGQPLIGGNTYHTYKLTPVSVRRGEYLDVEFGFQLPILAIGDYSIVAAIGNGTLEEHYHVHWMHDALMFKVIATSIDGVIVGMPLDQITMQRMERPK